MPTYISVFKRKNTLTKKELCEILGLDTSRADLRFTNQEILSAYRKRFLIIHPDRQMNAEYPLDGSSCTELREELEKARDILLEQSPHSDNAFQASPDFSALMRFMTMKTRNQVNAAVSDLVCEFIDYLARDEADIIKNLKACLQMMQALPHPAVGAQMANGRLLLLLLSELLPPSRISLAHIINDENVEKLGQFLLVLHNNKPSHGEAADRAIQAAALDLFGETFYQKLEENNRLGFLRRHALLIYHGLQQYEYKKAAKQWLAFYANTPTWSQLFKTYFAGTFLRTDTLAAIYQFNRDWFTLVGRYKGWAGIIAASPMVLVSLVAAPAKLYLKACNEGLEQVAGPLIARVLTNAVELVVSPFILVARLLAPSLRERYGVGGVMKRFGKAVAASVWNLTGGLIVKTAIDVLDTLSYLIAEKKPFVKLYSAAAGKLESHWAKFKELFKSTSRPAAKEMSERTPLLNRPRVANDPWLDGVYSYVHGEAYESAPLVSPLSTTAAVGERLMIEGGALEQRRSSSPIPMLVSDEDVQTASDQGVGVVQERGFYDDPDSGSEFEELPARRLG